MKTASFTFACILFLAACKNDAPPPVPAPVATVPVAPPPPPPAPNAPRCFVFAEGRDTSFISISIEGTTVTGLKSWAPWEKDGGHGSLKGTISGDTITAIFDYMIEGSIQAEEVMFRLVDGKLLEGSGSLTEFGKILKIKNKKTIKWTDTYTQEDCAKHADRIEGLKAVVKMIEEGEK
jgi:hypothetical protein